MLLDLVIYQSKTYKETRNTKRKKNCKIKAKLVLRIFDIDINDNNPWQQRQKLVTHANGILKSVTVHCHKQVIK